jgi:putative thioredoxin
MLELNPRGPEAPAADPIRDTTEAGFMADVVEASREVPVIVDFWATWCGPCKTLGPMLEEAVRRRKGRVRMVKLDVDRAQQIAAQLRIQSIPTVYAFWQGQPVDGFQGAVPQSEVDAFVERAAAMGGDGGLADAIEAAEGMLAQGAAVDAAQTFAAILQEDPTSAPAYGGLVRAHLAMGETARARQLLDAAPREMAGSPELEAARAQMELAEQAENAGPVSELAARVEAEPSDHQARYDLATALMASGDAQGAVDHLLELFRRDREWNDGAAKAQLLTIFDAAGPKDPVALSGRRRLASMILA